MRNQNESLIELAALLYKWKTHIILASLIVGLITAGLSLMLPNYYKASTVFYAASPDLVKPLRSDDKRIYGSGADLDRLLSIAQSGELKYYLIDSFDLYNHYEIDSSDNKATYKLLLKLDKLYGVTKTKYDAVNLSIEDKDPVFASTVANAARIKIDQIAQDLVKKSQLALITTAKNNILSKTEEYTKLTDSLYNVRKRHNIFNTVSQGEAFGSSMVKLNGKVQNTNAQLIHLKNINGPIDSIQILESKLKGYRKELEMLNKNIKSYNEGYPDVINIERERKDFGSQLSYDKENLAQLEAIYNSDINAIHVIEEAKVPVIKSRPKRSILVVGLTMLTFALASLWVIVYDQFRKNNWGDLIKNA